MTLRNPSSWPVSLQLLPISFYPKPEAAVRLLHKWFGTDMQMINFTTREFQLTKACPYQGVRSDESGSGILHLNLQPLERRRVGVVFTPADYGKVTSLILIRNNLTVIDMIGVEGFGARELLKVGGRLPGAGGSLRFKVPESMLMDCRRRESVRRVCALGPGTWSECVVCVHCPCARCVQWCLCVWLVRLICVHGPGMWSICLALRAGWVLTPRAKGAYKKILLKIYHKSFVLMQIIKSGKFSSIYRLVPRNNSLRYLTQLK